jgi:hypothetical protein
MLSTLALTLAPLAPPVAEAPAVPVRPAATLAAIDDDYKKLLKEAGDDPDKLWELYEWSLEDNKRKKYRKRVLNKIIKVDPKYRPAREALGHVEFEGEWFENERARDKHLSKIAKERGLVKFDGQWVEAGDVPYLERGWKKDEATGQWYDPVARERLAQGWKQQDLVWIEPDEVENIAKGLWKCDDKWLSLDDANEWHNDLETPWVIPTKRAIIRSTATRETVEKAAKQAESAYFDMRKVFGFGGEEPVTFMLCRDENEYLRLMDGSEDFDLPQLDPLAMSAWNRAAFADLWFDFEEELYLGMGVSFWDAAGDDGDAYGIHDARFAYGLSFVESIDPCREGHDEIYSEGEVDPAYAAVRIESHKIPRWFRWGAACYASRWFTDNQVKRGGDPFWARKWSADNLERQGGLMSIDYVCDFPAQGDNEDTSAMINQAGLMVAYLVDGKDPEMAKLLSRLQTALEKRQDAEKIFDEIRKALASKEEQILAFMRM